MQKQMKAYSAYAALVMMSLTVAAFMISCEGGGGGPAAGFGGGGSQPKYDIQLIGPSATGAQVNRPFSMTLNFFAQGTMNPLNVAATDTLQVVKASGPGNLTGTVNMSGPNAATLTFSNLIIDQQGTYTLQVSGSNAAAPAVSASFDVGPQMDLAFTTIPSTTVYRPRTFSVSVSTIDPGTSAPVVSPYPISITVARNPAAGTGTLGGTTTLTLSGASVLTFTGLTYSTNETVTLQASAAGFNTAISGSITFDSMIIANPTVSSNPLINGNFTISATVQSATTMTPVSISPPIAVSVTVASGGGTLSGTTSGNSAGSNITIAGLRYSNAGPATFTLSSPEAAGVTTGAVNFGVTLSVTANGPTTVSPGGTPGPFTFSVRDGQNNLYTGATSQLAWALINTSTMATAQSGNATFSGGNANVTLGSVSVSGNYRLDGTITSPTATPNPASINITVLAITFTDSPGPFLALKSVRVGSSYADNVTFACLAGTTTGTAGTFGVYSGNLPAGLSLNGSTGDITGTANTAGAYAFTLYAMQTGGLAQPLRCQLDVFSTAETEIPATAPDLRQTGPYSVQQFTILPSSTSTPVTTPYLDVQHNVLSSYDNCTRATTSRIWAPQLSALTSPAPVLVHHHGRGQHFRDYNVMANHLASWGIITISIEDAFSFSAQASSPTTPTYRSPYPTYDSSSPGYMAGMMSGGGFQEPTKAFMELLNQAATGTISGTMLSGYTASATLTSPSAAPFVGKVDPLKVFVSGHSRGGGATHWSHWRWKTSKIRGAIFFMPYDLRHNTITVTGGGPYAGSDAQSSPTTWNYTINAIPTNMERLPMINFAAERDGDLIYPIADQLGDRRVGPVTDVTVYGANHNYLCDAHAPEGSPYITRAEQQARMVYLITAFIRRWSDTDGRQFDGILYTNEFVNATTDRSHDGIMGWRNMAERILIDDFQDGNTATNSLGGTNSLSAGSRTEASIYPNTVGTGYPTLGIRHNQMTLPAGTNATYTTTFTAQDLTTRRRVAMRIGQSTLVGYDWVTVRVRLTDSSNATATVTAFDRTAPSTTYLPDYAGSGQPYYNRFVDLQIKLANFTGVNMAAITRLELILETDSTTTGTRIVYTDDLRFE